MKARSTALRAARATLLVSLLVSCSGGGSADAPAASVSVPQVDFGPASNVDGKLRPVPNGFAFPNFTATAAPGNTFAGADLAAMFGDGPDVCASGTGDACSPTAEAASWAQMVNESRQSGHCEGFIVQSLSRFKGGQTPEAAQLPTSTDVVQGILRGFATQFIPETRAESKGWRKTKVRDVLAELVTTLRDGTPDYVLGVYGDAGGHAILPYAVEFASADAARIQVYDSNWPGRNRFVDVDIAAGTWKFSFQGPDPENDPAANLWYWWDVPAMQAASGLAAGAKPFPDVVQLLPSAAAGGAFPRPQEPKANLANNHLGYAITWFGLAATLLGVAGFYVYDLRRRARGR